MRKTLPQKVSYICLFMSITVHTWTGCLGNVKITYLVVPKHMLVEKGTTSLLTFLNDPAIVIQHSLHLTASHVLYPRLRHKGLAPVKPLLQTHLGPHRHHKTHVVFTKTCRMRRFVRIQARLLKNHRVNY